MPRQSPEVSNHNGNESSAVNEGEHSETQRTRETAMLGAELADD
jgi:hypothetical protein